MSIVLLPLDVIRTDGGAQPRASLDAFAIDEYAASMKRGERLPPVVVYYDGNDYWLAHGFHTLAAAEALMLTEIEADLRQGTLRDAILFSVKANAENGLIRGPSDKRRAVRRMLEDPEWGQWSDKKIAEHCKVSRDYVQDLRAELFPVPTLPGERKYREFVHPKTGKPAWMDVTDIGRRRRKDEKDEAHPRAAGVREREIKDRALAYAEAVRGIRAAFRVLPTEPEVLVAARRDLDADEIGRWATYFADVEIEIRERQERIA